MKANASLRHWLLLGGCAVICAPSPILRLLIVTGVIGHLPSGHSVLIFGAAIVAAAFILTWASETAEKDVSQGLALAAIALIAVLPEYAVDLYLAWTAPFIEENAHLATANMTGANRLLVGVGWPMVVFLFWLRTRSGALRVGSSDTSLGLIFLGVATLYNFVIPMKGNISLIDSAVLISLFGGYIYLVSRAPAREPELVGPALTLGSLPRKQRRGMVTLLFVYSAVAIFAAAEPFVEGLKGIGEELHIREYVLIQWFAPLASEAPELTVAAILALRGRALAAMIMLISSKVNQWTLLIGSLPVAYSISGVDISPLPMDSRQVEEVFLTAAQSAFAVAIFASLSISTREALLLVGLFSTQLAFTDPMVRYGYGGAYLLLAAFTLFQDRHTLPIVFRQARQAGGQATAVSAEPAGGPKAPGQTKKPSP
ncbi:MAG: sodium:calcium antiporter [Dehalococcoidia bacterium]